MDIFNRLKIAIMLLVLIVCAGTSGYVLINDYAPLQALFMTIITISTVGYQEIKPLTPAGEVFTIFLIIGGIGSALYTLSLVFEFIVEGHFSGYMRRRRMETRIAHLSDHFLICGFGRVGHQIAQELIRARIDFVVIDNNPEALERCEEHGFLTVEGNASSDENLLKAGILRSRGLLVASDSDPDNVFITLSAKSLKPDLFIVARASSDRVAEKLKKAGANRVISPYSMAGKRMATLITRPLVTDYLDLASHADELDFELEEIEVRDSSMIVGSTLSDAGIRDKYGVLVIAIHKDSGQIKTNPEPSTVFEAGDHLIVIGNPDQLKSFTEAL